MARGNPLELVQSAPLRELAVLDDDELMTLIQSRHTEALGHIIDRHQAAVVGYARCHLGDESLVSDVAQEVFLALWTQAERYRSQGCLRAYLLRIAQNHCRMAARRKSREQRKRDAMKQERQHDEQMASTTVDDLLERERRRQLRGELLHLPDKEREALILRYHNELSLQQIASMLGQPVGTVKSNVFRGLRRLQQRFAGRRP